MAQNYPDSVELHETPETRRYRICGVVQGVGFRPFVHRLARTYGATGWVLNDSEGVLIELQASGTVIARIMDKLVTEAPPLAKIISTQEVSPTDTRAHYETFSIRKSRDHTSMDTIIPPDTNVCSDCLREISDPDNHRYRYAFTNCTNCGPRYSIILGMPYDRAQSTMRKFPLCPTCEREYNDIEDRRYHAQPNACPVCGPQLQLTDRQGTSVHTDDIVKFAITKLKEGGILAIKSLGGFHLVADACNENAVNELRQRKRRDAKPFAVMVADVESASRIAFIPPCNHKLLESPQRPIVLLYKRNVLLASTVAPHNPNIGVMLPSTPLQHLLLEDPSLPILIMTSGNISGHPIVFDNDMAIKQLGKIADYFILNNRDIHTRVDDSVVRTVFRNDAITSQLSFLRRSRGYAPYPIHLPYAVDSVIALGAELKNTISIGKGKQVFLSQHIGDLKNNVTFKSHIECIDHLQNLLNVKANVVACDLHPSFRSTRHALENLEHQVVQVQHHHAHMASCMAENGLSGTTLGVIFDGTGYGTDGTIWGGEFLVGDFEKFERAGCLRSMTLPGGDRAVKEPLRVGISLLVETFGEDISTLAVPGLQALQPQQRDIFSKMATRKINTTTTSSMGRLFDGIAALMGVCTQVEYEAQAAIELEAQLQCKLHMTTPFSYIIADVENKLEVDYRPMIRELVQCFSQPGFDMAELSRRFHSTIVDMICEVCKRLVARSGTQQIVLSGGVFCNEFILVNSLNSLESCGFRPYSHQLVPTNDGGISLGQVVIATAYTRATRNKNLERENA
ncbi:carbamoyltransferase HypF [Escherichia coli]|uniref:carbamoyltransferase HypF n=1 Tax=Escherichia coli TaxID=562 RepID=UPI002DBD96BE|nr:carbamoyltransferase HypF [Escherichia coli]MEC4288276.1 carbamoyltransferase HypF [Escherichia coli]